MTFYRPPNVRERVLDMSCYKSSLMTSTQVRHEDFFHKMCAAVSPIKYKIFRKGSLLNLASTNVSFVFIQEVNL